MNQKIPKKALEELSQILKDSLKIHQKLNDENVTLKILDKSHEQTAEIEKRLKSLYIRYPALKTNFPKTEYPDLLSKKPSEIIVPIMNEQLQANLDNSFELQSQIEFEKQVQAFQEAIKRQAELMAQTKTKQPKLFQAFLKHEKKNEIAIEIKEEFKTDKPKNINILIEVLKSEQYGILTFEYGDKLQFYNAMKNYFDTDIGSRQSILNYDYHPDKNKKEFEAIKKRVDHILSKITKIK